MKKLLLTVMLMIPLFSIGCISQNESPSKQIDTKPKTISHHLIYLGESKNWFGEYEVTSVSSTNGNTIKNDSKGILTLTYKNKDFSTKDKVDYTLDSVSTTMKIEDNMSPNGILIGNNNNEDVTWLENNPNFTLKVRVSIHGQAESFILFQKSN